jgi:tetratricopeptide (TPR) repeat protein
MKIWKYIVFFCLMFNLTSTFSQTSNIDIRNLIDQNKFNSALLQVENSKLAPLDYNELKGLIYYGLYNPDSTIFYLKKSIKKNKKDDEILIKYAQALLWKKNIKEASKILKNVGDKNDSEYLKVIAYKHELLGEYKTANQIYDRVIKNEELPYGTMERKAILLSWMKEYDASINLLDEIIETKVVSKPLRIRCLLKKAEVLAWKLKFDRALDVLDEVLKIDNENEQALSLKKQFLSDKNDGFLINASQQLLWKKNYKDASPLLDQVKDKSNLEYLKVLAQKHELLGDYQSAISIYDQIIQKKKNQYEAMERKAILLSWMKQFDESINLLSKIIKIQKVSEPQRIRCKVKKAEILSWKKDFNGAIKILDAILKKDVKNVPARFVKAQIYEWIGKFKEAKNLYKEVLLIDPENNQAKLKSEKLLWVK